MLHVRERSYGYPALPENEAVGHVYAEVTFHGRNGTVEQRRLMIDTGATFTWIPSSLAEALGVERRWSRPFRLANGELGDRWTGEIEVEILGRRATTIVVFGEEKTPGLLGVYTLEGLLLEVNPIDHVLRPWPAAFAYGVVPMSAAEVSG